MTLTLHQLMICGKTAHLAMEFTFTSKGEYSLKLLTSILNSKEGDMTWVREITPENVSSTTASPELIFFCKFETYVNVISTIIHVVNQTPAIFVV